MSISIRYRPFLRVDAAGPVYRQPLGEQEPSRCLIACAGGKVHRLLGSELVSLEHLYI